MRVSGDIIKEGLRGAGFTFRFFSRSISSCGHVVIVSARAPSHAKAFASHRPSPHRDRSQFALGQIGQFDLLHRHGLAGPPVQRPVDRPERSLSQTIPQLLLREVPHRSAKRSHPTSSRIHRGTNVILKARLVRPRPRLSILRWPVLIRILRLGGSLGRVPRRPTWRAMDVGRHGHRRD